MPFQPLDLIHLWDGGANSRQLPSAIQKNESPFPIGMQFEGKKVSKAPGYQVLGTEADSTLTGYSLYNHRVLSTEEVLVKTIGGYVKYYDEVSDAWQLLSSTTYTTQKKWWFSSFNGYLYGGNDTDSMQRWTLGSWSTLDGDIAIGAATIDLEAGTGDRFANSGSGLIEGDTFAWTGRTADQLTGVSGVTAAHSSGARVTLEPTAYASAPKGKLGMFYRNRNYVVDAASPNFLYFSKLATNVNPHDSLANFTVAGSGAGDAGFIITDAPVLDMVVYITGTNEPVLVAFCANGISYAISVVDEGGTTVGSAVPFKVAREDIAGVGMTAVTENDLVFIGKSGTWRAMGYGESSSTLKTSRLSDEIQPTTSGCDWSDGHLEYFDRMLLATGKRLDSTVNNFVIVKDTNPNGFLFWDHVSANKFREWKDDLYFLSSVDGNVFKLFTGRSADGAAIPSSYPTYSSDFNAPLVLKLLQRIRLSGQISEGCTLTIKVSYDGTLIETFTISGSDTNIVTGSTGVSVGTVTFGTGAFASDDENAPIRKSFVAEWNMRAYKYFYDVSIEYYNNESDVDFLLDKQMMFAEVANQDLIFTSKIL